MQGLRLLGGRRAVWGVEVGGSKGPGMFLEMRTFPRTYFFILWYKFEE